MWQNEQKVITDMIEKFALATWSISWARPPWSVSFPPPHASHLPPHTSEEEKEEEVEDNDHQKIMAGRELEAREESIRKKEKGVKETDALVTPFPSLPLLPLPFYPPTHPFPYKVLDGKLVEIDLDWWRQWTHLNLPLTTTVSTPGLALCCLRSLSRPSRQADGQVMWKGETWRCERAACMYWGGVRCR